MKRVIKSDFVKEEYTVFKHKSGLEIMIFPKKGHSKTYAIFATKYGSIDNCFKAIDDKEKIRVPEGIAHFLEHKLFESEGESAFTRYAKTGASANAYTSFDKTAYLFSCTDKFEESLEILLDFVQNPYFTGESVAKEQGIIGQEISMYDDSADWRVFFNTLKAAYNAHPVKEDIAGTAETISKITPELLYKCYNSFYNLNEMVLCVCGDIEDETVLRVADKVLKEKKPSEVSRIYPLEDDKVSQKVIKQKLSVSTPLFNIGIKDKINQIEGLALWQRQAVIDILLELISGESSSLYLNLYEKGLINSSFSGDYMLSSSYGIAVLGGESKKPEEVYKCFFEEVERLKKDGISSKAFDTNKKALYGKMLKRYNSVEKVANDLVLCYITKVDLFDILEAYKNVSLEDANKMLKEFFNEEYAVLSVIEPQQ